MALLLYLLRDPVYNSVTIPAAEKVNALLFTLNSFKTAQCVSNRLPLLILQVCDVVDYVPLVGKAFRFLAIKGTAYYHQFHFYTSAS